MFLAFKHIDGTGKAASWKSSKKDFDAQAFVDGASVEITTLPTRNEIIDPATLKIAPAPPRQKTPDEVKLDQFLVDPTPTSATQLEILKILARRQG